LIHWSQGKNLKTTLAGGCRKNTLNEELEQITPAVRAMGRF